jgi:hypothetical protein
MLLPEAAEQSDVLAVSGRSIGVAQRGSGELDPIADGKDMVGIQDADYEPLRMEVAEGIEDGIEDFARFSRIERRAAEGRRESLVGRLKDGVEDDLALMIGSPEREQVD